MVVFEINLDFRHKKVDPAMMALSLAMMGTGQGSPGIDGNLSTAAASGSRAEQGLAGLLVGKENRNDARPAYLNYLFFDKEMNYKYGGYTQMTEAAYEDGSNREHEQLYQEVVAEEPGYFYIYLSNDGTEGGEAYFDDFTILTLESYIVQQTDYYPYGLVARNFVRENEKETLDLFQGKTYDELTGWYDFHARQYDAALGRWFGVDAYTHSMPGFSPFTGMANNPVMFVDPDGNEPITLLVLGTAAVIGGGLNLWSNADKVRDFKSGLAYFASGGGMLSLVNPWAGGALTSTANIGIDIATGNVPDLSDPWEVAKYGGLKVLDGVSAGQAGKLGRGLISFAESGRFAWNSIYHGSNAKFTPISKKLGMAGGLDMGKVTLVTNRVKLTNIAATTIRQGANLADNAAKTSSNLWKVGSYKNLRGLEAGLDAHHVGQRALMKKFVPGYNSSTAPSILVPKAGHTIGTGVLGRGTSGFTNARQILARDIFELRRVYGGQGIPNSSLQRLIQMNKQMYPGAFIK
jgi:RHS repeat-associated protein